MRPLHALLVCALIGGLVRADAQSTSPTELRLYTMDCARMRTSNGIDGSDPCFLIRHPQGDLLWDAGLPQSIAEAPNQTTTMGGATITVRRKLTDMLGDLSLTAADIEFLSLSHTHPDHVGNAALFTSSTWIVDVDERTWAFRPEVRRLPMFASYQGLETMRTRLLEGDGDHDVFGDGSVVVIQAPGHTPGHAVLLLRLAQAGPVLLAGDIWNTPESRAERRGTPQQLAAMDKVERILSDSRARLVRQHVGEDVDALPRFPDYLR